MPPRQAYLDFVQSGKFVRLSDARTWIAFTGKDRQEFVNKFCTNAIRELKPSEGREAFITDVKGHTIGHGQFWADEATLWFSTVANQASTLIPHFDRYLIREQVEIADQSAAFSTWLVGGEKVAGALSPWGTPPEELNARAVLHCQGVAVAAGRVDWLTVPAWELVCPVEQSGKVEAALLVALPVTTTGPLDMTGIWNTLRIEACTPLFGRDITPANLPQEINRDSRAISFTKGCYLGQETVARIDALGHVNKLLVGWQTAAPFEAFADLEQQLNGLAEGKSNAEERKLSAAVLLHEGKPVGTITSLAQASDGSGTIGLGFVKRALAKAGTILQTIGGQEIVVR